MVIDGLAQKEEEGKGHQRASDNTRWEVGRNRGAVNKSKNQNDLRLEAKLWTAWALDIDFEGNQQVPGT